MELTHVAGRGVLEQAFKAARKMEKVGGGLHSITDGTVLGRVEEAWVQIEGALRSGYQLGRDAAQRALDSAIEVTQRILEEAGSTAKEVHDRLVERLQEFMRVFIQAALARIPSSLEVGGITFKLSSLKCTQKLVITGALKTSLTEVFSLVSTGELEIATEYALPPAR